MRSSTALVAFLAALASPSVADACAVCAAGDPTLTSIGEGKAFRGRFRLSVDGRIGSLRVGDPGVDEIVLDDRRLALTAVYAPVADVSLLASMPVLWRTLEDARRRSWSWVGPGDLELRGRIDVVRSAGGSYRHGVALDAGVELPTAPSQDDLDGAPLAVVLQPGMRSIVPLLGVSYQLHHGLWSIFASATVLMPTQVRDGPPPCDAFRTSTRLHMQPTERLAFRTGVDTRVESSPGAQAVAKDSGGFVGYVATEIVVGVVTDLVLSAGAHFPVVQLLEGEHREGTVLEVSAAYDL